MARHGENIRKRKDGRWEGRFLVYDEEAGRKVYHSVYAQSYKEVRRKMDIQKKLRDTQGNTVDKSSPCEISFLNAAREWLVQIKNEKKPSTYAKYSTVFRCYIETPFTDAMISGLADAAVAEKISDHLSDSVRKSIYCVLNQILKYASERYTITTPVLTKPVSNIKKKPVKVFSRSGQKALVKVLYQDMDHFKLAVLMCLFTGLRLGEVCALKWSDIDLDNKVLTVNRTVQRLPVTGQNTKTALVEMMPKSECSRREIPLSDTVLKLLTDFQNGKEYMFGGDRPLDPRTLQYHFKKILKEAEQEDKNFHILRHTFATNCIEGGMDVKSLSEILGHSDVQTTLRLYVHPSMDTKRKGMEHIAQFYEQIRGQVQCQAS